MCSELLRSSRCSLIIINSRILLLSNRMRSDRLRSRRLIRFNIGVNIDGIFLRSIWRGGDNITRKNRSRERRRGGCYCCFWELLLIILGLIVNKGGWRGHWGCVCCGLHRKWCCGVCCLSCCGILHCRLDMHIWLNMLIRLDMLSRLNLNIHLVLVLGLCNIRWHRGLINSCRCSCSCRWWHSGCIIIISILSNSLFTNHHIPLWSRCCWIRPIHVITSSSSSHVWISRSRIFRSYRILSSTTNNTIIHLLITVITSSDSNWSNSMWIYHVVIVITNHSRRWWWCLSLSWCLSSGLRNYCWCDD